MDGLEEARAGQVGKPRASLRSVLCVASDFSADGLAGSRCRRWAAPTGPGLRSQAGARPSAAAMSAGVDGAFTSCVTAPSWFMTQICVSAIEASRLVSVHKGTYFSTIAMTCIRLEPPFGGNAGFEGHGYRRTGVIDALRRTGSRPAPAGGYGGDAALVQIGLRRAKRTRL